MSPIRRSVAIQLLTARPARADVEFDVAVVGMSGSRIDRSAFLAGTVKKKLRLILDSKKAEDGVRRYRVVQAGA